MQPDLQPVQNSYATPISASQGVSAAQRVLRNTYLLLAISMIPTGIAIALPVGFEAQVRPRSGLAAKHGVTILNSPGTIDADYRGEIKAILVNLGDTPFVVEPNARIAQLIVAPVMQIRWEIAESLPETVRGEGGFGSTGLGQTGA